MKDFLKEKISYYKLLLTFFVTALFGMSGWYFSNRNSMGDLFTILAIFGFIAIITLVATAIYKIRFYIDKLKEED